MTEAPSLRDALEKTARYVNQDGTRCWCDTNRSYVPARHLPECRRARQALAAADAEDTERKAWQHEVLSEIRKTHKSVDAYVAKVRELVAAGEQAAQSLNDGKHGHLAWSRLRKALDAFPADEGGG